MSKDRFFSGGGQSEIDALEDVLNDKYIIVSPHVSVTSTSSSGTASTLMKQVADAMLSYLQAMPDSDILILKGVSLPGITYMGVTSTGLYYNTKAATSLTYYFTHNSTNATTQYLYSSCFSTTASSNFVTQVSISSSGTTFVNHTSSNLTGKAIMYGYQLRKITQ